jgi:hypothetical protein
VGTAVRHTRIAVPAGTTMAERKPFLLRVDRALLDDLQRWANDDLRSLNGQIEFLLRNALQQAGRANRTAAPPAADPDDSP